MRPMTRLLRVIALLAIASAARAQAPSAGWRTIVTAHFRVYYPRPYEAWATRAASRLESIRAAVVREVGFDAPQRIDVIVANPIAGANGLTFPFLDTPRIVLFAEAPGPEEQIGAYTDWIDLLAAHEIAHAIHMLRPSRNPLQRAFERFVLPLDPITFGPRWVLEGYATVLEGRVTGAGRPSSSLRAAILRQWAANGRMPSYSQLNSDSRFLGMSMAYLAGSAFLEWLERRTGEGSLRRLWARMTARQRRSFATSFSGVFGDSPERLYGRFVAELTASAMTVSRSTELREGEWWQDTPRSSGDPAVSFDGAQVVIVMRPRSDPPSLVVWSTAAANEKQKKFEERMATMIRRDPEDVAPVPSRPLPRKVEHSFRPADGGDLETPRWTRGGEILFSHRQPDGEGFLHHDLFLWNPSLGTSRRVTRLADVFDADPFPDGRSAVAVRTRNGLSQLVTVDLENGSVRDLTAPGVETVYSHPRVSRDGSRIAYVANRGGTWKLFVRNVATGTDAAIVSDVDVGGPEWDGDDIIATILSGGFAELHRISPGGERRPLTRSVGASFSPAVSPDGRVFFMGLDPDGLQLRVIDDKSVAPPAPAYDAALVPALPLTLPPARFESRSLPPSRPYGVGRQEAKWLVAESIAPSQSATEVGVRVGDVIGRLDTFALASIGRNHGQRGAAIASKWRGWPIDIAAHAFTADDHFVKRHGVELRGSWSRQTPLGILRVDAGALAGKPLRLGFASAEYERRHVLSAWRANEEFRLAAEAGSLTHIRGVARGSLRRGSFSVGGRYQHDETRRDATLDVGGITSSIIPLSAIPNRVFDPALPTGTLGGRRYDGARLETTLPGIPATIFYQTHRTDERSVDLAGLEFSFASLAEPILRYPGIDFTAGVARIFDEPLRNRTKWWFAMRWRP